MSFKISKSENKVLGLYWVIRKGGEIIARLPVEEDPKKYIKNLSKKKSKKKSKLKKVRKVFGLKNNGRN